MPVDGSEHANKAISIACDLAQKYNGRIALLHILADGKNAADLLELSVAKSFSPKLTQQLKLAASNSSQPAPENVLRFIGEKILEQAKAKVIRRGVEVEVLPICSGDPAETILMTQGKVGASTIVMGCRGVSDTKQSSHGSVSNAVFSKATCTCLSVK
ncbi:universal stress protein [Roseibium sp. H3510]|uniref:Universal stress protein n=1 Tax=Roseibium algae TaxID=3123038 RepID=A0ABU8TIU1_9HYPH